MKGRIYYTTLEISGNYARVLNVFLASGISFFDLRLSKGLFTVNIPTKLCKKAFALLDKLCYNYKIIHMRNTRSFLRWMFARIGVLVGCFMGVMLVILSLQYVWRIEISGNNKITDRQLFELLRVSEAWTGVGIGQLDLKQIEGDLLKNDKIINASITLDGVVLKVEIVEKMDFVPPNNATEPSDIVSQYDGTVTRIVAKQGTALVKIGDHVPKGKVLIGGYLLDTSGNKMVDVHARGEVYGRGVFAKSVVLAETHIIEHRTGKSFAFNKLKLWDFCIGDDVPSPFERYMTVSTSRYLSEGMLLPIIVDTTTYIETITVEVSDLDSRVEQQINAFVSMTALTIGSDYVVKHELTRIGAAETSSGGGVFRLDIFIEAEVLMGETNK